MARKKSKKRRSSKEKDEGKERVHLPRELKLSIWAIVLFVLGVLAILAGINQAGTVGEVIHDIFVGLLGTGYFLLPLFFFILGISLLRPQSTLIALPRVISSLVFFLCSLGLVELIMPTRGGLVGKLITNPMRNALDDYATGVILIALILISLIVIFERSLTAESLRERFAKKDEDEDIKVPEEAVAPAPTEETPLSEKKRGFSFSGLVGRKAKPETKEAPLKSEPEETMQVKKRNVDGAYVPPPLSLLETSSSKPSVGDVKANANLIKRTLANFGIDVEMDEISIGPTVTRYALKPAEGVKLSKILGLQNNLELALAAHPVRIEAPIPGRSLVGIEVPNTSKATVRLAELLSSTEYKEAAAPLLITLGKGISGTSYMANLAKAPHLLIAGATGSGKSVTIHALINSLLFRNGPRALKFIMVDPKRVELTLYNGIPHLLTPVITDAKKAILALKWAGKEMERRYDLLEKHRVRDITSYHSNILPKLEKKGGEDDGADPMPYIVVIIDELADLMQSYPRELESAVVRLAQMSRAVGIHLVLSTQRPSVNVITGLIKANVPSRIALQVSSQVDSRTILDTIGAEKLLGAGDMLYQSGEMSKPVRLQSAFITEKEVKSVSSYLSKQYADELPQEVEIDDSREEARSDIFDGGLSDDASEDDELYEEARATVIHAGKASTSYLQRKLRIGYSRAARLMDILEEKGVIGPQEGTKPREVIVPHGDSSETNEEDSEDDQSF